MSENKNGSVILTYTGKLLCPINPNPDNIDIEDIAHALSMICRFGGHSREFYCVTPDTKILTSNLDWIDAGDLKLGDGLVGFDENTDKMKSNHRLCKRRMKYSSVLHTGIIKRKVYELHLSDGTVLKSSEDHPWLVSSKKSRNQKWENTKDIVCAINNGKQRFMLRFLRPWENIESNRETGYLEGIFDGEGTINCNRNGFQISVAQKPGAVLDKIKFILDKYNYEYFEILHKSGVVNIQLKGNWQRKLQFLGTFKPVRLLDKYKYSLTSNEWRKEFNSIEMLTIEKVVDLGIQDVVALETSSRTYFANGFGAHNSVAQHSFLCSSLTEDPEFALVLLLHDASEAYIHDIITPLKPYISSYKEIENTVMGIIFEKFGLSWPLNEELKKQVKRIDNIMLLTEFKSLMPRIPEDCEIAKYFAPLDLKIRGCDPETAKGYFIKRFNELMEHKNKEK